MFFEKLAFPNIHAREKLGNFSFVSPDIAKISFAAVIRAMSFFDFCITFTSVSTATLEADWIIDLADSRFSDFKLFR